MEERAIVKCMQFLSALVYVSWGALAAIMALHGFNSPVVACTFVALIVVICSRRTLAPPSGAPILDRLIDKAIGFGLMLLCIGIWVVMSMFPMPLAYGCWAGAAALVPVVLLYSPVRGVRLGTLGATGLISGFATFLGAGFLLMALDDPGDALDMLQMFPAAEMQIAAICALAVSPISLAATIYLFWKEVRRPADDPPVQIQMLLEALGRDE